MIQLTIIVLYFLFLIFLGYLAKKKAGSSSDFLIAGRNLGVAFCTVAIVGEWLGGMSTIGTSERAFSIGFSPMWYNISTALGMIFFAILLAKMYRKNEVHTVGEMIEKIYCRSTRIIASLAFVIAFFILSFVQLKAIGALLAPLLSINIGSININITPATAIIIAGIVVTMYTYFGGIWSVSFTNMAHVILIFTTLITAFIVGLVKMGGYSGIFRELSVAISERPEWFGTATVETFKSPFGIGGNIIISWILGGVLAAFASQAAIQPVFAAKNIHVAKRSSIYSAFFIAPLGFIVSTLGIIAATGRFGYPVDASGNIIRREVLPYLFMNSDFLPPVIGGLAMAGILAAILSTIAPVMLAISTILTKDIMQLASKKELCDRSLMKICRASTIIIGLLVIPAAIYFKGFILDTAYISYAIRSAGSIIVLLGVFWVISKNDKKYHFITPSAAKYAILFATLASLFVVVFKIYIVSKMGNEYWKVNFERIIILDKVYVSLLITFFVSIVVSALIKKKREVILLR